MVSAISGTSMMGRMGQMQTQSLTDEQKQTIQDILSEYDPDEMTEADAKEIFKAFEEAGVRPSMGMREAIEEAGFDAEELREMGRPAGGPPPGGQPPMESTGSSNQISVSMMQSLQTILNQYDLTNLSSDDQTNLMQQLTEAGLTSTGSILDLSA